MNISRTLQDLKRRDDARPSFPGEHWLTAGAGLLLMRRAGRSRSLLGRMAGRMIAGALLARAASGRDGLLQRARTAADATPTTPTQQADKAA